MCRIDKTPVKFLIDSGSAINTVTEEVWKLLLEEKAIIHKRQKKCNRELKAYASEGSLKVLVVFEAWIEVNDQKPRSYAEFFVVSGADKSLLCKSTAERLKVLKVGLNVNLIEKKVKPFPKFANVLVKLAIDESVPPRKLAYYRVPAPLEEKVNEKLLLLLQSDIIEKAPGAQEWISPLVVVPKGKGDVRLCVNMKLPNEAIKREHFPLPVIETFLNKLRGACWFTKLDLTQGFHHVELHPASRYVTTFMTGMGLMRYKRLMFGINCAPEIFQRIMTEMLRPAEGVIVFIDDIVIFAKTREEHDMRLKKVLSILKQNNATLNKEKCKFGVQELEVLGFKVDAHGIKPTDEKVKAIANFREPASKEEVRSFLGLVTFVGHFIPDLATRSEELRKMIRGEAQNFGKAQREAFDDLRQELVKKVRRLGYYDPGDKTELYVDASPVGLGAVLVQRDKEGRPRIISLASKSLTKPERIFPQTQRECLAVVWGVERFYLYLFGLRFTVFTDHKTLEYLFLGKHQDGKRACSRAEGWRLRLQPYDFELKHIAGKTNIADVLSRLCTQVDEAFDDDSEYYLCAVSGDLSAITLEEIRKETEADATLSAVIKALESGEWPGNLVGYQTFQKELGVVRGIVIREDRIVLPEKLRKRALLITHKGHPGKVSMKKNLRQHLWWPGMDKSVEEEVESCLGCKAVSRQDAPEPMKRKELPQGPWQEIAIDFFSTEWGTLMVMIDYYSRFVEIQEMKTTSARKTTEALDQVFAIHSFPNVIWTDNGQPYPSEEFTNYCKSKNIRLIHTIPYWPQMNGEVERQNRGILRALRIAKVEKTDWRKAIKEYLET